MAVRIRTRRGTIAQATSNNPILGLGEIGVITDPVSDSQRIKIGDGVTAWNSLPYFNPSSSGGVLWGGIGGNLPDQTDLQNALNAKQNTITTGTNLQYFRGDLSLATFPTSLPVTDGDYGDITVSASGATWTIDNNAVTFAKIQQATLGTSVIARQPATAGNFAELQATANGQFLGRQSGVLGFFDLSTLFLRLDGTNSPTANINFNSFQITNLNAISAGSTTIDLLNGNWKWLGVEAMNASVRRLINASGTQTADWDLRTFTGDWTFLAKARFASGQAIADANGNNLIGFPATIASAVNWLQISNSISGNPVLFEALGGDTNIGITATTKGTTSSILLQIGGTTRLNISNTVVTSQVNFQGNASITATTAIVSNGRMMEQGAQNTTPTNGGATTILSTVSVVNIDPAGVIATHTYTLPASTLNDGTVITLTCGQNGVTALTLNPGAGTTVVGAITTISAGQFAKYRYRSSNATYYRIG